MRTVVLGLGNPILGDDAAGLLVAGELETLLTAQPLAGVTVLQSTRAGFELIEMLTGFDRAIIIDCLQQAEPEPGRIHRLSLAMFNGSARLHSAHDINLRTAFELAQRMHVPMPETLEIYGVEGADTLTFTEYPSPQVAAVVGHLAQQLHSRLAETHGAVAATAPGTIDDAPLSRVFYPPTH